MADKEAPAQLDTGVEMALAWAIEALGWKIDRADPSFVKIQQIKSQAASLVAALKARTDPAALRGGSKDAVGEALARRLTEMKG